MDVLELLKPNQNSSTICVGRNAKIDVALPRVLVKKPATRLKIPFIAFGQGHILAARKTLSIGDHFGRRSLSCFAPT